MNDKRWFIFLFVIVLIFVVFISYLLFFYGKDSISSVEENLPVNEEILAKESEDVATENETENNDTVTEKIEEEKKEETVNSSIVHWGHMPLTYMIINRSSCDNSSVEKLENAMDIIKDSTNSVVSFEFNDSSYVDIEIICYEGDDILNETGMVCKNHTFDYEKRHIQPVEENLIDKTDFVISIDSVVRNDTDTVYQICFVNDGKTKNFLKEESHKVDGDLITEAYINIYNSGGIWNSCSEPPVTEIHKLLHSFGIGHSEIPKFEPLFGWVNLYDLGDVMFPYKYCKYQKQIDEKYSKCLESIYSEGNIEKDCLGVNFD